METFLVLLIAIPLAGAFLIPVFSKLWKRLADIIAGLAVAAVLGIVIYLLLTFKPGTMLVYNFGSWPIPLGIVFAVDSLGMLMLLVISVLLFFSYLFAIKYMEHFTGTWKFYTLLLLLLVGMNGVAMTGDLFNMFVFIEIASISSYALVAFGTEPEELEAGFKYMVMGEIASLMILCPSRSFTRVPQRSISPISHAFFPPCQKPWGTISFSFFFSLVSPSSRLLFLSTPGCRTRTLRRLRPYRRCFPAHSSRSLVYTQWPALYLTFTASLVPNPRRF